jgi:multiple sugar transport system permease protein
VARPGEIVVTTAIANSAAEEGQIEAGSLGSWVARFGGKAIVYTLLILWTFIALFPIYWTLSTSMKLGRDVVQGHLIP